MAVGATNLALRDLIFQGPQRNAVLHERADVFTLIPEVIEVEHGDVRFAAVDARMTEQVLPDRILSTAVASTFRALARWLWAKFQTFSYSRDTS